MVADEDTGYKIYRKRQEINDVFTVLYIQIVEKACKVQKFDREFCDRKTSENCPFDSVWKRRWFPKSKDVSANGGMSHRSLRSPLIELYKLTNFSASDFCMGQTFWKKRVCWRWLQTNGARCILLQKNELLELMKF